MLLINDFQELAQPHTETTPEHIDSVQAMTAVAPWFADAQILLLKMLKQQNHPSYSNRLIFLSLYAANRQFLLEYLAKVSVREEEIVISDME